MKLEWTLHEIYFFIIYENKKEVVRSRGNGSSHRRRLAFALHAKQLEGSFAAPS
jgi:hypothetical protein